MVFVKSRRLPIGIFTLGNLINMLGIGIFGMLVEKNGITIDQSQSFNVRAKMQFTCKV